MVAAAGKITPDREQTLNALLDEFQQALESGVMEKILLANRAFRFEIYHYADMPTLYAMIEQLWVRTGPSLHFYMIILNLMIIKTALICTENCLMR